MGITHIVTVRDDGLTMNAAKGQELESAVGEAVVTVCVKPQFAGTERGPERITWHPVMNHGNCVQHVTEMHSSEEQIFIWAGNRLRSLQELRDEEIDGARRLFEALYAKRKAPRV